MKAMRKKTDSIVMDTWQVLVGDEHLHVFATLEDAVEFANKNTRVLDFGGGRTAVAPASIRHVVYHDGTVSIARNPGR